MLTGAGRLGGDMRLMCCGVWSGMTADGYNVIVVDPPWPVSVGKFRNERHRSRFPYQQMSLEQICSLRIPAAANCHVWLWTTQRFLPDALSILGHWEARYVCTFVWHKPGGVQMPGSPAYNAEFALLGKIGSPRYRTTKRFPTCFDAPRRGHSEKPDEFYEMVRRVTEGPRLDMFNRRSIPGFHGWGDQAPDAVELPALTAAL